MVRDPQSGKYRRTRLFVLTLGYSRKSVRLLVFRSSVADLGRTARAGLPPAGRRHARRGARQSARGRAHARHLRSHAQSAVPRRARSTTAPSRCPAACAIRIGKGKVESGVGHAQKTPLKGQRFESLEEAQAYLDHWEERWADTRIHGTTKRQVAAMFAEEKPALLPLPLEPFRYYQYGERTVHLDGCVEVEAAYYSAPPGWIGRRVQVQWDGLHVRLLDPQTGQLLREHLRQAARPPSHPRRRPPAANAARHAQLLAAPTEPDRRSAQFCRSHARAAGRDRGAPHSWACCRWPRSTAWRAVDDACAAALEIERLRLPLRAPLSGAQPATAAELAAGRSADPPTHSLPRPHRTTKPQETEQ